jgi:hypothetical protein
MKSEVVREWTRLMDGENFDAAVKFLDGVESLPDIAKNLRIGVETVRKLAGEKALT